MCRHQNYDPSRPAPNCRSCKRKRREWLDGQGIVGRAPHTPTYPTSLYQPPSTPAALSWNETGDAAEVQVRTEEEVRTLEALIRVCDIDTNEWEVERYVCNKWEVGMKPPATTEWVKAKGGRQVPMFVRYDDKPIVQQLYQVKAWLRRKRALIDARAEIAALIEDAKQYVPARPALAPPTFNTGNLLEIGIADLHVGKLAWQAETGYSNYDSKIAEQVANDALEALIARTSQYRFERVLLVLGNDLLHADNKFGQTTSGTQLENDSRYQKTFLQVRRMVTGWIERLRQIAPVDVLMVPGNHDTLSVWHLGDSLTTFYHATPDVEIDNAPTLRKYYQHGNVMLMFTHGDKGKKPNYPMLMASEEPAMFADTLYREAHTGHFHHLEVQEHFGVRVRILSALCPPDAWHSERHLVGQQRQAEAFVWNAVDGLMGTAVYTVPNVRAGQEELIGESTEV